VSLANSRSSRTLGAIEQTIAGAENLLSIAARHPELGPSAEDQDQLAAAGDPHLAHPRPIDDRRAVDADKESWIQVALEVLHGLAVKVGLRPDVDLRVVVGGFDPVDLVDVDGHFPA